MPMVYPVRQRKVNSVRLLCLLFATAAAHETAAYAFSVEGGHKCRRLHTSPLPSTKDGAFVY